MKNKILFWLDSDFLDFVLAYYLQEKTNADFYAIIAITNKTKNFFKTQKLVNSHSNISNLILSFSQY